MADQSDKIRVLIVDDIADTRDNIEKLLFFEKDMQVIGKAATGREAITQARQLQPDIILMDINMPDMDGIAATEAIVSQMPHTQVIIMSVQGETDYLRRAMLAGARQFLTKPVSGDELSATIRAVHKQGQRRVVAPLAAETESEATGQVIAVYSPKGGTGKSTVAANLALALKLQAGSNLKVCLVDGNLLFGDLALMFNVKPNKTINDLTSRINDLDKDLINDVTVTHPSQLRILVGPSNPQAGELVTADHIRSILDALMREYDYVVVDTQSSFQDQTMAILDAATKIVLVMTMEMSSIKNIGQFLEVAELLEYSDDKIVLVLNKADARFKIRVDQVEQYISHKVSAQIAYYPVEVLLSINNGVPLIIDKPSHQVSHDIIGLSYLLSGKTIPHKQSATQPPQQQQPAAKKEEPRGLFARLTKR